MKDGHAPIHIMRWAPADYVNDPFIRKLYQKRDWRTLAFYSAFLFYSHMEGGDLPSDPEDLAAMVFMPPREVTSALALCVSAGKIHEKQGRLYHKRVVAEVIQELEYREQQRAIGKRGGRPKRKGEPKGRVLENQTPPSPAPTPTPAPISADAPAAPDFPSRRAANVYLKHYPKGEPPGAMFKQLRPLVQKHGWDVVEPELEAYLTGTQIDFHSWPKFAAGFGSWANGNGTALVRAGPPTDKAAKRFEGMQAFIRGGLKRDGGGVDRGREGASDASLAGPGADNAGVPGRCLPEVSGGSERPPVAPRGSGDDAP